MQDIDPKCREDLPPSYVNKVHYDEVRFLGLIIAAGSPEFFEGDAFQHYERQVNQAFPARNAKRQVQKRFNVAFVGSLNLQNHRPCI